MPSSSLDKSFLDAIEPCAHFEQLIGCFAEINYFAKDGLGRFVAMDEGFVKMLGCKRRSQVLGKTDFDFFPKDLAAKYVEDDHRVMATGQPIRHLAEPIPNNDMTFNWWQVNKVPLRDRNQKIIGLAGLMSLLSEQNAPSHYGKTMFTVLEYIGTHYGDRITVNKLADIAGLSSRSFERNFFNIFNTPPVRYVNRVRLQAVRRMLTHTNQSLASIATECGFYDQSHMTAMFTRHFGISPRRYRDLPQ